MQQSQSLASSNTTRKLVCMIRCQEAQWKKFLEEHVVQTLMANKIYSTTPNLSLLTAKTNSIDWNQIDPLQQAFLPQTFSTTISLYLPHPDHQNAPDFPKLESLIHFHFHENYSKTDRYFMFIDHFLLKFFEVEANFLQDILVQRLNRYIQRQSILLEGEIYEYATNRILRCGQVKILGTHSGKITTTTPIQSTSTNMYFIEMEVPGQTHLYDKFENQFYKQLVDQLEKLRHQDSSIVIEPITVPKPMIPQQQQPSIPLQPSIATTWERLVNEYVLFFKKVYQSSSTITSAATTLPTQK